MLHFVASVDENVTLQEPGFLLDCLQFLPHTTRVRPPAVTNERSEVLLGLCLCQSHPLTPFTTAPCELPPLL